MVFALSGWLTRRSTAAICHSGVMLWCLGLRRKTVHARCVCVSHSLVPEKLKRKHACLLGLLFSLPLPPHVYTLICEFMHMCMYILYVHTMNAPWVCTMCAYMYYYRYVCTNMYANVSISHYGHATHTFHPFWLISDHAGSILKSVHHTYRIIMFCYLHIYSYRRKYKEIQKCKENITYTHSFVLQNIILSSPHTCQTLAKSPSSLIIAGPPTSSSFVKEHGSLAKDYISQPPLSWVLAKRMWAEVVIKTLKGEGISSGFLSLPAGWGVKEVVGTGLAILAREKLHVEEDNQQDGKPVFLPWSDHNQPGC